MGKLVRYHAGDFLAAQRFEQARRGGDGGILRIAAGGEGVRLGAVKDVDPRHRQPGARREVADEAVVFGRRLFVDFFCLVHGKDHLVRLP